ncbi:reverse transcriptase domain-containing protein [Tanacetum coccineum]
MEDGTKSNIQRRWSLLHSNAKIHGGKSIIPVYIILGRTRTRELRVISSTIHAMVKFHTPRGIACLIAQTTLVYECRWSEKKVERDKKVEVIEPEKPKEFRKEKGACQPGLPRAESKDWHANYPPSDIVGVPRRIIKHNLNINVSVPPVAQKQRVLGTEKSQAVIKEVEEWVKARIGYHQIQMSEDDEEKMAFYTDQGTYCYTKIPFGLKNAGTTYQSKTKHEMIMDIAETFDSLQKVNMKLNQKKCSFGVKDGKFLGEKDDYRWTKDAERAFQEMKKMIIELPTFTTPDLKETMYILNKLEVSRKLAKYTVELGAYNITYVPGNAIKGKVLDDFINEVLVGTKHLEICNLADEESLEELTLYTDGASSSKGVGAGLVLIDHMGTKYTYAIRLNFPSTNNEAKYEAFLAGLQIAEKMKVRALKVKVDSKLVDCQLNGEFVASSEGMTKYLTKAKEYVVWKTRKEVE